MYVNTKAVACLGVALAAWLVPMPVSAQDPTDETLKLKHIITLPDSQVLRAFDISWVNPRLHTYSLAASALTPPGNIGTASNPAIVGEEGGSIAHQQSPRSRHRDRNN